MSMLGDLPALEIQPRRVVALLRCVAARGVSPRTVNWYRSTLRAIFNYGMRATSGFGLESNPAAQTRPRREDGPSRLEVFSVEEIEALARVAAEGSWRRAPIADKSDRRFSPGLWDLSPETRAVREAEDAQLADVVRLAAYSGLRQGELRALRWRDVHWGDRVLFVERAVSDTVEGATKGRRVRVIPLADQALAALDRVARRRDFTGPDDYVFVNPVGGRIDDSALRRRYQAARDAAGLPPLRFHDLRHTAGTLLARVLDPATVRDILGHSDLRTTARYLHAVRASALADSATRAFCAEAPPSKPRQA
jgi:integrase